MCRCAAEHESSKFSRLHAQATKLTTPADRPLAAPSLRPQAWCVSAKARSTARAGFRFQFGGAPTAGRRIAAETP